MANPSDLRALIALAHYNASVAVGKTISLHLGDSTSPVTGWTGLYAIIRQPRWSEAQLAAARGSEVNLVVEVARQGTFTGANLRNQKYKVKYGDVYYEIVDVTTDDAATSATGRLDAAVYTLMCKRLDTGIGEGVGM